MTLGIAGRLASPLDPGRVTSPLDQGRLRSRLAAGDSTIGIFVGAASAVTAEVCAAAGVDWVLLDLEHGAGGEEQVGTVVLAAGAYGVPTVVRVESAERIRLGRVLDLGAAGVMLPRLDTAAEVQKALRHLRYPPDGDRGVATYNRACRFGLDPKALEHANADVLTVVQIESARAVEQVEDIAAVDGVDVLFVGPRDLSHDLGLPGDTKAPSYLAALNRVRDAARRFEKSCGVLVPTGTAAAELRAQGWNFLAVGSDSSLLATAVSSELAQARRSG
jgi:4-hydroxy-2-oxoheptanedioate aldolase